MNEARKLFPRRSLGVLYFLGCLGVTLACIWVFTGLYSGRLKFEQDSNRAIWVPLVMGILSLCGTIAFAFDLWPGSCWLSLDSEGFTTCSSFREDRFLWREIELFGYYQNTVGFKMLCESRQSRAHRIYCGYDYSLTNNFGYSTKALVTLLNQYKDDASNVNALTPKLEVKALMGKASRSIGKGRIKALALRSFLLILETACLLAVCIAIVAYAFGYERAFALNQRLLYFSLLAFPAGVSLYAIVSGKWRKFARIATIAVIPSTLLYFWIASPPYLILRSSNVLNAIKNQSAFVRGYSINEDDINWLTLKIPFFQSAVNEGWAEFLLSKTKNYRTEIALDELIGLLNEFEWVQGANSSRLAREQNLDWSFIEHELNCIREIRQVDFAFKAALSKSDFTNAKLVIEQLVKMQQRLPTESRCRDIVVHLIDDYSLCLSVEDFEKATKPE